MNTYTFNSSLAFQKGGEILVRVTIEYTPECMATLHDPSSPSDACISEILVYDNYRKEYMDYNILDEDVHDELIEEFWWRKQQGEFSHD